MYFTKWMICTEDHESIQLNGLLTWARGEEWSTKTLLLITWNKPKGFGSCWVVGQPTWWQEYIDFQVCKEGPHLLTNTKTWPTPQKPSTDQTLWIPCCSSKPSGSYSIICSVCIWFETQLVQWATCLEETLQRRNVKGEVQLLIEVQPISLLCRAWHCRKLSRNCTLLLATKRLGSFLAVVWLHPTDIPLMQFRSPSCFWQRLLRR